MLISLGVAALAAFFVVAATTGAVVASKREAAAARDSFERYKLSANKEISEANARAAEAELETEQLREQMAYRRLNGDAFVKALEDVPKLPVEIMYLRDDSESMEFAQQIAISLEKAGWKVLIREPIPQPPRSDPQLPTAMTVGGQPTGVTVVANAADADKRDIDFSVTDLANPQNIVVFSPYGALQRAFLIGLGKVSGSVGGKTAPPAGRLRIVVAPREGVRQ